MPRTDTPPTSSSIGPMAQQPSVGRMVHFYLEGAEIMQPVAAIVAGLEAGDRVTLHLFPADGASTRERNVAFSETPRPGAWSWPPRV